MMHDWHWGGGMILGPLYFILWAAILVAVIMLVVRWMTPSPDAISPRRSSARDILDERFARGEIEQDEYEKRRAVLDR